MLTNVAKMTDILTCPTFSSLDSCIIIFNNNSSSRDKKSFGIMMIRIFHSNHISFQYMYDHSEIEFNITNEWMNKHMDPQFQLNASVLNWNHPFFSLKMMWLLWILKHYRKTFLWITGIPIASYHTISNDEDSILERSPLLILTAVNTNSELWGIIAEGQTLGYCQNNIIVIHRPWH